MSSPHFTEMSREDLKRWYEEAARAYQRTLTLEHYMESVAQATQRKITVESMDLVHEARPDVQTFNELLVQYPDPYGRTRKPRQVVPDNAIVVHDEPIEASGSYDVVLQPVSLFCTLEYVSKNTVRKDYEDNMEKYEHHLKVPYYLLFYPDHQELTLYRHNGQKYVTVLPNEHGRYPIPEIEVEVGLLDEWVRYWFRGKLLPLPGELQRELNKLRVEAAEAKRLAEEESRRADEEKRRADEEKRRADEEKRRADKALQDVDLERNARLALEAELERMRHFIRQQGGTPPAGQPNS